MSSARVRGLRFSLRLIGRKYLPVSLSKSILEYSRSHSEMDKPVSIDILERRSVFIIDDIIENFAGFDLNRSTVAVAIQRDDQAAIVNDVYGKQVE